MSAHRYLWRADIDRVVDGDTLDVIIDCGFHATRTERLRLLGVNCPEMHGPSSQAGVAAKSFTNSWCNDVQYDTTRASWPFLVETFKTDAFGRYLARVWPADQPDGVDLAAALLEAGHAVVYER